MDRIIEVAAKTERKLNEQISEFNILRDRILVLAAYGITLIAAILSFWKVLDQSIVFILAGAFLFSLISISIMLYAAHSNPLSRGMDTSLITELIEDANNTDDFFLHEVAYNIESFKDNKKMLRNIQYKFNLGLLSQIVVTIVTGISIYLNNI